MVKSWEKIRNYPITYRSSVMTHLEPSAKVKAMSESHLTAIIIIIERKSRNSRSIIKHSQVRHTWITSEKQHFDVNKLKTVAGRLDNNVYAINFFNCNDNHFGRSQTKLMNYINEEADYPRGRLKSIAFRITSYVMCPISHSQHSYAGTCRETSTIKITGVALLEVLA